MEKFGWPCSENRTNIFNPRYHSKYESIKGASSVLLLSIGMDMASIKYENEGIFLTWNLYEKLRWLSYWSPRVSLVASLHVPFASFHSVPFGYLFLRPALSLSGTYNPPQICFLPP